jgi:hypothetical protein
MSRQGDPDLLSARKSGAAVRGHTRDLVSVTLRGISNFLVVTTLIRVQSWR